MSINYKNLVCVLGICFLPTTTQADIITFDFTGRLVVVDPSDNLFTNAGSTYTPIAASLSYDTVTGFGSSGLSITMDQEWNGSIATFHDISMSQTGANLITGSLLVDWGGGIDMPLHIEWDATGLFNAIAFGLQAGDVLSGSDLYYDANGNGVQDTGEFRENINSATPYSSYYQDIWYGGNGDGSADQDPQGPAPMAATSNSLGLDGTTPFPGFRGYLDIGSGNSMHVTSVSTVPVPAAVWLFGSGLVGLIGVARRKKT